ncbi:MAG: methylenetetrahydrofolate--tRNA-(uracil(54)-C(5))-methyltransferase (FADH(2)-oxidizing) TrmFO [Gemmatimonadetes bacterium]|nr:methylenetetrahydrofolate--tRNA-(uracil(54)-C(5))-methyltransferase (FADH(2)-oxidizing) TrmFO [Gemmatimonadota bacterium]
MNATVVGGGLAGCEAAWALAERGVAVTLCEMRPTVSTPAHKTDRLAEIVCSNTFKSTELTNAHGLLKAELRLLGSLLLDVADQARVPGGAALAVDRRIFSDEVTRRVVAHPRIAVAREEVTELPSPAVIATGPLTSDALALVISARLGATSLAFYDAIAPIVSAESLEMGRLYRLSRYGKGGGDDYLNAPLSEPEYDAFVGALATAEQFEGHDFDAIPAASAAVPYFEGCLPIEEMARRGKEVLRFGPMKPVGLPDPRTGREPFAVVQLRQEDRAAQMWNLVGFQTRMKIPEQKRVFATLPGLAHAEFLRYGSIHRNTYLNSPATLTAHLSARDDERLLFAGQLVGVEGYTESLGTGLLAGINLARLLQGERPLVPPPETMLGALLTYVHQADPAHFQPMNANFGLLPPLDRRERDKQKKKLVLAERALEAMRGLVDALHSGAGKGKGETGKGAPRFLFPVSRFPS